MKVLFILQVTAVWFHCCQSHICLNYISLMGLNLLQIWSLEWLRLSAVWEDISNFTGFYRGIFKWQEICHSRHLLQLVPKDHGASEVSCGKVSEVWKYRWRNVMIKRKSWSKSQDGKWEWKGESLAMRQLNNLGKFDRGQGNTKIIAKKTPRERWDGYFSEAFGREALNTPYLGREIDLVLCSFEKNYEN